MDTVDFKKIDMNDDPLTPRPIPCRDFSDLPVVAACPFLRNARREGVLNDNDPGHSMSRIASHGWLNGFFVRIFAVLGGKAQGTWIGPFPRYGGIYSKARPGRRPRDNLLMLQNWDAVHQRLAEAQDAQGKIGCDDLIAAGTRKIHACLAGAACQPDDNDRFRLSAFETFMVGDTWTPRYPLVTPLLRLWWNTSRSKAESTVDKVARGRNTLCFSGTLPG